jgi:hypothetical protein
MRRRHGGNSGHRQGAVRIEAKINQVKRGTTGEFAVWGERRAAPYGEEMIRIISTKLQRQDVTGNRAPPAGEHRLGESPVPLGTKARRVNLLAHKE